MGTLRIEFVSGRDSSQLFSYSPLAVVQPTTSDTPPTSGSLPTVPNPSVAGDPVFARVSANVPTYIAFGASPDPTNTGVSWLITPGRPTLIRVTPGQKVSWVTAGDFIFYTEAELAAAVAAASGQGSLPIVTPSSDQPASFVFPITADANNDLPLSTRAIRCDTGGTLVVNTVGGSMGVTLRFADGETRPVRVTRVISIDGAVGIEGMA